MASVCASEDCGVCRRLNTLANYRVVQVGAGNGSTRSGVSRDRYGRSLHACATGMLRSRQRECLVIAERHCVCV